MLTKRVALTSVFFQVRRRHSLNLHSATAYSQQPAHLPVSTRICNSCSICRFAQYAETVAQAGAKKQMSMSLTLTNNLSFVLAGDKGTFPRVSWRAPSLLSDSRKRPSEFCSGCLPAALALKCFLALWGLGKHQESSER